MTVDREAPTPRLTLMGPVNVATAERLWNEVREKGVALTAIGPMLDTKRSAMCRSLCNVIAYYGHTIDSWSEDPAKDAEGKASDLREFGHLVDLVNEVLKR